MSGLAELLARIGPTAWPLLLLGVTLYAILIERLIVLLAPPPPSLAVPRAQREALVLEPLRDELGRGLGLARALVLAAPLLGLLGTVQGLATVFTGQALGDRQAGLAVGIGQALLSTWYGLAIALPGLLLLAWCRRRIEVHCLRRAREQLA